MNSIMSSEIREQPAVLGRTLDSLLPLRREIRSLAHECRAVMFVARGSSDNAAVYGRYLLETHAGVLASLAAPSVGTHYAAALDLTNVLVVSISQSGETAEIVATQEWAKRHGARTLAVTNAERSSLASAADLVMLTRAGEERAVPATKTYTSQLAAMAVLGTALGPDMHSLDGELLRVPDEVDRLVTTHGDLTAGISLLADTPSSLVTGRGLLMGTALEVALKLEETCLRPVRGLSYADLRHGPIAVVSDELVAVLVSAADGPMVDGMAELAEDLRQRRIKGIVGLGGGQRFRAACDVSLPGPRLTETIAPLAAVIPGQLLAEGLAVHLGLSPDAPRGLRKVTQTDRATT